MTSEPATAPASTAPHDVVHVTGSEALRYLQSQLSQDLDALAVGERTYAFVLQPNGKVVGWFAVVRDADAAFRLIADPGAGDAVRARLERFRLRTDVAFRVEPGEPAPDDATRVRRGIPAVGHEISESTIPGELGAAIIAASVSFTKGCYTGQELVARVDSRGGNVPKPIRRVLIDGSQLPPVGATVHAASNENSDGGADAGAGAGVVGHLTTVAEGSDGTIAALGIVMRRVEPGAAVQVRWNGHVADGHVEELATEL